MSLSERLEKLPVPWWVWPLTAVVLCGAVVGAMLRLIGLSWGYVGLGAMSPVALAGLLAVAVVVALVRLDTRDRRIHAKVRA